MRSAFEAGNSFVFLSSQPTSPGIRFRPFPLSRAQSHGRLGLINQLILGAPRPHPQPEPHLWVTQTYCTVFLVRSVQTPR